MELMLEKVCQENIQETKKIEDAMKKLNKKSNKDMKDKFKKIDMGDTPRIKISYSQFEMNSNLDDTFIPLVKEIYKNPQKSPPNISQCK